MSPRSYFLARSGMAINSCTTEAAVATQVQHHFNTVWFVTIWNRGSGWVECGAHKILLNSTKYVDAAGTDDNCLLTAKTKTMITAFIMSNVMTECKMKTEGGGVTQIQRRNTEKRFVEVEESLRRLGEIQGRGT